jgi:YHS domain-containing protein
MLKPLLAAVMVMTLQSGLTVQAGVPGSKSPINLDAQGVALGGYDPVAYFDGGKPMRGVATISATYGGARYLFATQEHRRAFLEDPKAYIPEFGGFCVLGTAFGEKVDIDPETGKVVNGKLYLNNNPKALEIFNKDRSGTITKAQTNWPAVKDKAF